MSERVSKMNRGATVVEPPTGFGAPTPDMAKVAMVMMNGWTAIGSQMITYTQMSLEASMAAAEEIRRCQSAQDMVEAQMRYARGSYARYLDGVREIGGLVASVSSEAIDSIIPTSPN